MYLQARRLPNNTKVQNEVGVPAPDILHCRLLSRGDLVVSRAEVLSYTYHFSSFEMISKSLLPRSGERLEVI